MTDPGHTRQLFRLFLGLCIWWVVIVVRVPSSEGQRKF